MKIDPEQYLTVTALAEVMAATVRGAQRSLLRAVRAGDVEVLTIFGKRVVRRADVAKVEKHYYPFGGENRSKLAKAAGHLGGATRAANYRAKRAAESGKAGKEA